RPVGIAFARGERVAERDHHEVLDDHLALAQIGAVRQPHRHRHARLRLVLRPRYPRDRELVLAGLLLLLDLAAGSARLPGPVAIAGYAGELVGRDRDDHGVGLGQDVVLFGREARGELAVACRRIAARPAVGLVAGLVDGLCSPAHPALLIEAPGSRRT